ncbi:MAG: hypothetical protein ABW063_16175, partial [Caulobacter sp.]
MARRPMMLGVGLAMLACAAAPAALAQTFDATFKPVRQGGEVTAIEVVSVLADVSGDAPFSLSAP